MKFLVQHYVMLRVEEVVTASNMQEAVAAASSEKTYDKVKRLVKLRPGYSLNDFGAAVEMVSTHEPPAL